jgi:hypothetical protein
MCTIRYTFAEVNRPGMRAAPGHGTVMNFAVGWCMWKDPKPKMWRKGKPIRPCFPRSNPRPLKLAFSTPRNRVVYVEKSHCASGVEHEEGRLPASPLAKATGGQKL